MPPTIEIGNSTYTVARVTSTQKLPIVFFSCRAKPRTNAMATAIPAAAEAKFWTVKAAICTK